VVEKKPGVNCQKGGADNNIRDKAA